MNREAYKRMDFSIYWIVKVWRSKAGKGDVE